MEHLYACLRKQARMLALSQSPSLFYRDYTKEALLSEYNFYKSQIVKSIRAFVESKIENDFGHGLDHAEKVTLDAGALVYVEGRQYGWKKDFLKRRVSLVQVAGMLHDMKRKEENHAVLGASYAHDVLKKYKISAQESNDVENAIRNHEAFKNNVEIMTNEGKLISDCLYDADKFQWGTENFITTLWDMVSFHNIPIEKFIKSYPKGIDYLKRIKSTFRTGTGKKYGPEIIDVGIKVGKELFKTINTECKGYIINV